MLLLNHTPAVILLNMHGASAYVACEQIEQYNAPAVWLTPGGGGRDGYVHWEDDRGVKWVHTLWQPDLGPGKLTMDFIITGKYKFYTVHFSNGASATYRSSSNQQDCEQVISNPAADVQFIEAKTYA